jgi:hypothetical protein
LPGDGIEYGRWIDPAVAAGNHHDRRGLHVTCQLVLTLFLIDIGSAAKPAIAINQMGKFRHQKRSPRTTWTSPTVSNRR